VSLDALLSSQPDAAARGASRNASGLTFTQKTLDRAEFVNVNFMDTKFEHCRLRYGYFERCYFRRTSFNGTELTGSRFRECNFHGASFDEKCDLEYAEFRDCKITFRQVQRALPHRENILHELARNLRINAHQRGDSDDYRQFLRVELRASETYKWRILTDFDDSYYAKKYRVPHRVRALFQWIGLKVASGVWGYGESPWAVIRFGFIVILLFALLYGKGLSINGLPSSGWYQYLLFSTGIFTTVGYGAAFPASLGGQIAMAGESILGIVFYGLLVAVLYNRFSRR
jgi:hypothetical protein